MKNPIKMDDLGVPLFSETPMWQLFDFVLQQHAVADFFLQCIQCDTVDGSEIRPPPVEVGSLVVYPSSFLVGGFNPSEKS